MRELSEYEKTILDVFQTNGRSGLHQYLVFQGMSDDEAESTIDTLDYLPTDKGLDNNLEKQFADQIGTHLETVTFVDGSTKEIEVGNDGTVVSSMFPNGEKKTKEFGIT